jgi:hypothetical protein
LQRGYPAVGRIAARVIEQLVARGNSVLVPLVLATRTVPVALIRSDYLPPGLDQNCAAMR